MQTVSKLFNGTWRAFKTLVKVFILLFVFLLILTVVTGTGEETTTGTTTGTQQELTVVEKYNINVIETVNEHGILHITGTLMADKDYDYLQISIPCYDSEGNKMDSAFANINNLEKGETWKWEALATEGTHYNIDKTEVSGW